MKNTILITGIALFTSVISLAQASFQGQATYETKTNVEAFTKNMPRPQGMNITPEMEAQMKERMRKAMEKTFVLTFDKTNSIYKEQEKLDATGNDNQRGMRMMMNSISGGGGTYFKDVKEKTYTVDKDFMGKEFLVKDTLTSFNWKMTGETKKIGDYTVYKATAVIPVDASDMRNLRPAPQGQENSKDTKKDVKDKESKTNFFASVEIPKEKTITAWYTPEVPVNQGPDVYWGLPGLILEVSDGTTITVCTKIAINPKDKVEIKAPKKGKAITQKEFNETVVKKMQEMRDQFQNGGNRQGPPRF